MNLFSSCIWVGVLALWMTNPVEAAESSPLPPADRKPPASIFPEKWDYVWGDEFLGTQLDTQKWQALTPEKLTLSQSVCIFSATASADSSAVLEITSKYALKYGRMEVSAQMPSEDQASFSIGLLGISRDTVFWPTCGELILQQYPTSSVVVNYEDAAGEFINRATPYVYPPKGLNQKFYTYAVEWNQDNIKVFVNNQLQLLFKVSDADMADYNPFRNPHTLRVKLNVKAGHSSHSAKLDYVRFYAPKREAGK